MLKGMKKDITEEDINNVLNNCLELMKKPKITGQKKMAKKIFHRIKSAGIEFTEKEWHDYLSKQQRIETTIGDYTFNDCDVCINAKTETSLKIDGNTVTLNQEGCYTLVIPVSIYMTDNDGITFKLSEKLINYTFMVFNADTYFDNLTGKPNISPIATLTDGAN